MAVKKKANNIGKELLGELEELTEEELDEILSKVGFSIEDAKGNVIDAERKISMIADLGEKKIKDLLKESKNSKSKEKIKHKSVKKVDKKMEINVAGKTEKKKWTKETGDDEDGEAEDGENEEELDVDVGNAEEEVKKLKNVLVGGDVVIDKVGIKGSKPITQIKKGDKVKVDGVEFQVDAHYVLIDHGKTKEMAIEIFNPKTDKDFQLRYFVDQLETSMEFYELQEIVYVRRPVKKVEW